VTELDILYHGISLVIAFFAYFPKIEVGLFCVVAGGSSISTVSDYRLEDWGSIPGTGKGFFSTLCPPSLLYNGHRGSFVEGKARPGHNADPSPPSSAEAKNE
jgi:hypothetical protein